ncbi:MAG: hypothetical protein V7607_1202 [Solirubrobacteraceae bacterium]
MTTTESPFTRARRMPMLAAGTPLGNLIPALAECSALADGEAVDALTVLQPAVEDFLLAPLSASGLFTLDDLQSARAEESARTEQEAERVQAALREVDRAEALATFRLNMLTRALDELDRAMIAGPEGDAVETLDTVRSILRGDPTPATTTTEDHR